MAGDVVVSAAARDTAPRRRRPGPRRVAREVLPLAIALMFLFPFVVMVGTSLTSARDVFSLPPTLLPKHWDASNFSAALRQIPFLQYLANTLLLCAATVAGSLVANPLIAYALSKIEWKGRRMLFVLVLGSMMLPPQVTLIPVYLMWNHLGLTNNYLPLIVPAFLGGPFYVFLLRQYFLTIPGELSDAARIDGASDLRILLRIVIPLARPALATIAVFQFVATWTDFLYPLLYLNDQSLYTLSLGLFNFFTERGVQWGPLMAACVLFTIPAVVIFVLGQRHFVEGIATKGFK